MEKSENENESNSLNKKRERNRKHTDSEIPISGFKHSYRRTLTRNEALKIPSFKTWKWCDKVFVPCRWFDSIELDTKISKCCLTFNTFKTLVTIILISVFLYAFLFSILGKKVLPGGSVFFLLVLFHTSYIVGYIATLIGLPEMIGHLITGITFGNIPVVWLPDRSEETMDRVNIVKKRIFLVIALVRSGLLLDLNRMKNYLKFIFYIGTFPFVFEFLIIWIVSPFILNLEWDWSALQGTTISIVSLATITSVMFKNKKHGYGEDKNLSTVLITAAVVNVVFGVIMYYLCLTYINYALLSNNNNAVFWNVTLILLKQFLIGILVGFVAGFLVSFFPDKRNPDVALFRIMVLGIGSFGITSLFHSSDMNMAAVIACFLMCFICTNVWEEIGWRHDSNPVLYFFNMAYYIAQPMVLSLLGYSLDFEKSSGKDIGLSLVVFLIGLIGRELICIIVFKEKSYRTTLKEKIFICIAWFSKGTFQVLLAFSILPFIQKNKKDIQQINTVKLMNSIDCIQRTTMLSTLILTPLSCFCLTFFAPKLLTRSENFPQEDSWNRRRKINLSRTTSPKNLADREVTFTESQEKVKREDEKETLQESDKATSYQPDKKPKKEINKKLFKFSGKK